MTGLLFKKPTRDDVVMKIIGTDEAAKDPGTFPGKRVQTEDSGMALLGPSVPRP